MAKTLGKAGGFSANEAVRNVKRTITVLLLMMFTLIHFTDTKVEQELVVSERK